MKFFINKNLEFYKLFYLDFTLINKSFCYTSKGDFTSNYYLVNWCRFLKAEYKRNSLAYLQGLTEEQKLAALSYTDNLL